MQPAKILAPILFLCFLAGGANAAEDDRYTMEPSGDGFVRMDRTTGEMSICTEKSGQLVCKLSADDRMAFEDEIERLDDVVKALDERIAKLENSRAAQLDQALPSDEEIDRTVDMMGKFLRGFMGVMKDVESKDPASENKT